MTVACGEEGEALPWGRGDQDLRAEQEPAWPYVPDRRDIWLTFPCHCPFGAYICEHSSTCPQGHLGSHIGIPQASEDLRSHIGVHKSVEKWGFL